MYMYILRTHASLQLSYTWYPSRDMCSLLTLVHLMYVVRSNLVDSDFHYLIIVYSTH